MASKIQIKRSSTTAIPTGLANGELAYSGNNTSNSLFVGALDGSGNGYRIAGGKYPYLHQSGTPGIITSNAVVILDSNAYVSNTYTQGLVIQPSSGSAPSGNNAFINSISTYSNGSYLGATSSGSNNELVSSYAIKSYVDLKAILATTPAGSNGNFQYNDSGTIAGTSNFNYNKDTGIATVGNSEVYVQLGYLPDVLSTQHNHANVNNYVQVIINNSNNGQAASGDFVVYNDNGVDGVFIDMGLNSSGWSNAQWTINGANDGYLYTGGGNLSVGTNAAAAYINFFTSGTYANNERFRITDTSLIIANDVGITANGSLGTTGQILASNGSSLYWSSTSGTDQDAQYYWTNTQTFSNTITFSSNAYVSGNLTVVGMTTTANADIAAIKIRDSALISGSYDRNIVSLSDGDQLTLNGGNYGIQFFASNSGSSNFGLKFNPDTGAFVPNQPGVMDLGTTSNTFSKLWLSNNGIKIGDSTLTDSTGTLVTNNVNINTNLTVNNIIGTLTTVTSNVNFSGVANIDATAATLSVMNAIISGNLTINGSLTSVNTTNISVKDNMIKLADNNLTTDTLDIGFYGTYGNATQTSYSGLYRDQSSSGVAFPLYRLFRTDLEPTATVDINDASYVPGGLLAWFLTPKNTFTANSTALTIQANTGVNVTVAANTLTLTQALGASYGGTGHGSYAVGDLLYADTTTSLGIVSVPGSAANGQVLQIVNNLPAYGTLDGGTF